MLVRISRDAVASFDQEFLVRFNLPAAIGLLCLAPLGVGLADAPSPAKPAQPATAPTAAPANSAASAADGQTATAEAARHAQRTQCIKDARAKKLVGAARNAYIKACIAKR
jgi:hypothetical protein